MNSSKEEILKIEDVYFSYDNTPVLESVNFKIVKGDYVGIVGPNGAGKSTLLKLILNILKPIKGKIELLGTDLKRFKSWGRIGYVSQRATSFNTGFPASVEEVVSSNLFSTIGLFKSISSKDKVKVIESLRIVGLEGFEKRLIGKLSGGQQQKAFIARALINNPELIILDEPTTNIDIESQNDFYNLLDQINKNLKITILLVSHDINAITNKINKVACITNRTLILHDQNNICADSIFNKLYGGKMKPIIHNH